MRYGTIGLLALLLTGCGGTWFPEQGNSEPRKAKFSVYGDQRTSAQRALSCHRTRHCTNDDWMNPDPDYVGFGVSY
ncbi:hypothetical protein [Yersinia aldovae]|uniref:hypothetical protein n=1 Tax=Yersinia aldovae TaxID=29483 RepID=UPI0005ACE020|nr:hypothetical protein [Yersinia aldovae]AJJ64447.1 hypothetical protein AT01_3909 [Yersinia aldovae 670-83]